MRAEPDHVAGSRRHRPAYHYRGRRDVLYAGSDCSVWQRNRPVRLDSGEQRSAWCLGAPPARRRRASINGACPHARLWRGSPAREPPRASANATSRVRRWNEWSCALSEFLASAPDSVHESQPNRLYFALSFPTGAVIVDRFLRYSVDPAGHDRLVATNVGRRRRVPVGRAPGAAT